MPDLQTQAVPVAEKLLQSDEDQLFAQLGLRKEFIDEHPAAGTELEPNVPAEFAGKGLDFMLEVGQEYFNRVNRDVYALLCGDDNANAEERAKLQNAFGLGNASIAGAITAAAVTVLHLPAAVAVVIAALIVKLFVKDGVAATCAVWHRHLPAAK